MKIRRPFAIGLRIAALVALIWAARELAVWAMAEAQALESGAPVMAAALVALIVAYTLLIAIPFVPGIEIGLSVLMIGGAEIAPAVWAATILGLALAYLAGRLLPETGLIALLLRLRLRRAADLLITLAPLGPEERLELLRASLPGRFRALTGKQRYLLLAILVNLPGNSVLGGGGGILMMAGFSRLFAPLPTLITLAFAIAPVPLLVYGFGVKLPLPGL